MTPIEVYKKKLKLNKLEKRRKNNNASQGVKPWTY